MRVFVAVDVNDSGILQELCRVQEEMGIGPDAGRRVESKNMHFTLQFIGEVSDDDVKRIGSALKTVDFEPFELEISGMGAFPDARRPRVIWAGTDMAGGAAMERLALGVGDALRPLGFRRGETFRPHLTVFRVKKKAMDTRRDLDRFGQRGFGSMTVSEIRLKESRLGPSSPAYSDLEVVCAERDR